MPTEHPITPPPEMVQQWFDAWAEDDSDDESFGEYVAVRAAQWGADQELKACARWASEWCSADKIDRLLAARRPKPPSLKQQALAALDHALEYDVSSIDDETVYDTIRRALEALPDE